VLELVENEAPNANLDGIAVFVSLNPLP